MREYKYGFASDIESDAIAPGLTRETVLAISDKFSEPDFIKQFRLSAYDWWLTLDPPTWGDVDFASIDFQKISYYSAPKNIYKYKSLDEVDPKLIETFNRLGVPLHEQKALAGVAVDAVFDSVSVFTTFKEKLSEYGIVFCSISEAIQKHPEIVKKYLGSVVPYNDNFYSALNSAVFSDGSFVYVPEGVSCPLELVTYFRINDANVGQFERTLIIAESRSSVSYLEGCTAPVRKDKQVHSAVVEIVCLEDATVTYSTVQNWYSGDEEGNGGILNLVTKRGACLGDRSKISWNQVEMGSSVTWKYPSVVMYGKESIGEFFSVSLTTGSMQADTGTKMIHVGEGSRSTIVSKGIAADMSKNTYRGIVCMLAEGCRNFTQCDSMIVGNDAVVNTFPDIRVKKHLCKVEHEAHASKMDQEAFFYLNSRGINKEDALNLVVTGFCKAIVDRLPMEFAQEMKMLSIKLENSVG